MEHCRANTRFMYQGRRPAQTGRRAHPFWCAATRTRRMTGLSPAEAAASTVGSLLQVLATDMSNHFTLLAKFRAEVTSLLTDSEEHKQRCSSSKSKSPAETPRRASGELKMDPTSYKSLKAQGSGLRASDWSFNGYLRSGTSQSSSQDMFDAEPGNKVFDKMDSNQQELALLLALKVGSCVRNRNMRLLLLWSSGCCEPVGPVVVRGAFRRNPNRSLLPSW
jgi:hypothetical protein